MLSQIVISQQNVSGYNIKLSHLLLHLHYLLYKHAYMPNKYLCNKNIFSITKIIIIIYYWLQARERVNADNVPTGGNRKGNTNPSAVTEESFL